jgi:endo-1,4-beta-D-glucanase Y
MTKGTYTGRLVTVRGIWLLHARANSVKVSSTRLIVEAVMSWRRKREQETSEAESTTPAIPHAEVGSLVGINVIKLKQHFGKSVNERIKALTVVGYFLMICTCLHIWSDEEIQTTVWKKTTCRYFSVFSFQDKGIRKEVRENDMYRGNQSFCVYMSAK